MVISFNNLGNYGRLGNQMFQYALIRSVANKNNYEMVIPNGNYDLLKLNIQKQFGQTNKNTYGEKYFHFNEEVFSIGDNTDFYGYFQSYKYFDNIRDILLKDFSMSSAIEEFSNNKIQQIKNQYNTNQIVSLHIRRKDYLLYPEIHPVCTMKYYKKCMSCFEDSIFYIFADDLIWAKENFKGNQFIFSNFDNITDLCLMMKCNHNIVSNSSYSWWATYLNQNINKIIKYPSIWFGKKGPQDLQDLIPTSWEKEEV